MNLIVGIDFGTSTTVVRYKVAGESRIHELKESEQNLPVIPSAILKLDTGEVFYGQEAIDNSVCYPDASLYSNFKMMLISKDENTQRQGEGLTIEFLSYIYKLFREQTEHLRYDELDVRVSYPAKWSDATITFMKKAVRIAGFKGRFTGIPEPQAASYNMLHKHNKVFEQNHLLENNTSIRVFMLDMGAGTTDIEIFKLTYSNEIGISITEPLSHPSVEDEKLCGGREIDNLLSHRIEEIAHAAGIDKSIEVFPPFSAKQWKDANLSSGLKKGLQVPTPGIVAQQLKWAKIKNPQAVYESMTLSREKFEKLTAEHWKKLYKLITDAISEYKKKYDVDAEDIDVLFLTGGHSRWYVVSQLFQGNNLCSEIGINNNLKFRKLFASPDRMFLDAHPQECVANGLCLCDDKIMINNKPVVIKAESVVTNSIWVSVSLGGKETLPKEIFTKGQPTRDHNGRNVEYAFYERMHEEKTFAFGNQEFSLSIILYFGSNSYENAIRRIYPFSMAEDKGYILQLFKSFFGLADSMWDFDFSIDFKAMDNGEIALKGKCDMNHGKNVIKFTGKNFKGEESLD